MKGLSQKNSTKDILTNRQALQARAKAKAGKYASVFVEGLKKNTSKANDQ